MLLVTWLKSYTNEGKFIALKSLAFLKFRGVIIILISPQPPPIVFLVSNYLSRIFHIPFQ